MNTTLQKPEDFRKCLSYSIQIKYSCKGIEHSSHMLKAWKCICCSSEDNQPTVAWEAIIELSGGWRPDFSKILTSKKGGRGELVMVMSYFPKKKNHGSDAYGAETKYDHLWLKIKVFASAWSMKHFWKVLTNIFTCMPLPHLH